MVLVMQRVRPPVALRLMNGQIVWLVAVGLVAFGEVSTMATLLGAVRVMVAGISALTRQARTDRHAQATARRARGVPHE